MDTVCTWFTACDNGRIFWFYCYDYYRGNFCLKHLAYTSDSSPGADTGHKCIKSTPCGLEYLHGGCLSMCFGIYRIFKLVRHKESGILFYDVLCRLNGPWHTLGRRCQLQCCAVELQQRSEEHTSELQS